MEKTLRNLVKQDILALAEHSKVSLPGFGDPSGEMANFLHLHCSVHGFPVMKLIRDNESLFLSPDLLQIQSAVLGTESVTGQVQQTVHYMGKGSILSLSYATWSQIIPNPLQGSLRHLKITAAFPVLFGLTEFHWTFRTGQNVFIAHDALQICFAEYGILGTKRTQYVGNVLQQITHDLGGKLLFIAKSVYKNSIQGFGDPAKFRQKKLRVVYKWGSGKSSFEKVFDEYEDVFVTCDPLQVLAVTVGGVRSLSLGYVMQRLIHDQGHGCILDLTQPVEHLTLESRSELEEIPTATPIACTIQIGADLACYDFPSWRNVYLEAPEHMH